MPYNELTDLLQRKYLGLKRRVLARALPIGAHYHVINEYPKSGGSWIGEMFSDALEIPYPNDGNNIFGRSAVHGHFMNPVGLDGAIVVWRDGRDVLTSAYHYYTREIVVVGGQRSNRDLVNRTRKRLRNSKSNSIAHLDEPVRFSAFLKMMLTKPVYPKWTWPHFVEVWSSRVRCHHVRYEDFQRDAQGSLQRLVWCAGKKKLSDVRADEIVYQRSFKAQSGRAAGTENASQFLRKGIVGDWVNHFSPGDERFFAEKADFAMKLLGYNTSYQRHLPGTR